MALVRKRNIKKIVVYIIVLVVILGLGGYYLYDSLSLNKDKNQVTNTNISRDLPIVEEYSDDLFNQQKYINLEEFGQDSLPLEYNLIEKGRDNPFETPL